MRCTIVSSEKKQQYEKVQSITLPAFWGEMQILPGHAESFIALRQGTIIVETEKRNLLPIEGGICYVKDDVAAILL